MRGETASADTRMAPDYFMQQSASQLFYRLLDGQADLLPLRILDSREFTWRAWSVCVHILGASHAVVLRRGDNSVTELLTCVHQEPALATLIGLQADEESEGCVAAHGLVCRVRLSPFCLDDGDALRSPFPAECCFEVAFPGSSPNAAPITRVGWRQAGPNLMVETLHSYPEENRGVRSVSLFAQEGSR